MDSFHVGAKAVKNFQKTQLNTIRICSETRSLNIQSGLTSFLLVTTKITDITCSNPHFQGLHKGFGNSQSCQKLTAQLEPEIRGDLPVMDSSTRQLICFWKQKPYSQHRYPSPPRNMKEGLNEESSSLYLTLRVSFWSDSASTTSLYSLYCDLTAWQPLVAIGELAVDLS